LLDFEQQRMWRTRGMWNDYWEDCLRDSFPWRQLRLSRQPLGNTLASSRMVRVEFSTIIIIKIFFIKSSWTSKLSSFHFKLRSFSEIQPFSSHLPHSHVIWDHWFEWSDDQMIERSKRFKWLNFSCLSYCSYRDSMSQISVHMHICGWVQFRLPRIWSNSRNWSSIWWMPDFSIIWSAGFESLILYYVIIRKMVGSDWIFETEWGQWFKWKEKVLKCMKI
jgi:hypothetical protein